MDLNECWTPGQKPPLDNSFAVVLHWELSGILQLLGVNFFLKGVFVQSLLALTKNLID